ncbi:DUF6446 family protein [Planktomarina temperata]|nr:DUF6446 family protein [Planktomarina temperata]
MAVSGKVISGGILGITAAFGIGVYYAQVYSYYETFSQGEVALTSIVSGAPTRIPVTEFQGIDADSSPIRYRACFKTPLSTAMLTETFTTLERSEPRNIGHGDKALNAACFDAAQIAADIDAGIATAYLGAANFEFGIDRIVAIYDDGRGFVWHQINECGDKLYDGSQASDDCPERDQ